MTHHAAHRLTEHRCKHCGALLALIDDRTRYQRFALRCAECGAHLVLRPPLALELSRVQTFVSADS